MSTFQEDFEAAQREVYGSTLPDLPAKKRTRRKQANKPRLTKMDHGQHTNKLKKRHGPSKQVLSENAKEQPRQDGKFASKSTFWMRLGEVFSGKAKRKINASRRRARHLDAHMGRASIPTAGRRRTRQRRRPTKSVEQPQSYRKSVFRQVLGF